MTAPAHPTGLLVLQGNRLELLGEAVLDWLRRNPLPPLEPEVLLVQSNGMAEWLKMALAGRHGICAATRVELPARFLWRAYRAVLGRGAVPAVLPLDKLPLTWRLMDLLPTLAAAPAFAPVAGFLAGGDAARRLQLAERLADLFDQYQVYRADWLDDWAQGDDRLRGATGTPQPLPADQAWQPALWRALLQALPQAEREATRPALHRRFVGALQARGRRFAGLPRRLVLFGSTHVPGQTLEALAALASQCQVLLAVPNPCRYHWADTIDGRELLRSERRRAALRGGRDLAAVPLADMHVHGHPLLAAWGRQSRDFVRQLDAFDDSDDRFGLPRVDLFDPTPGDTLLAQVQAAVRDLLPLAEHPKRAVPGDDRSIVFHVAHSAMREVEILHDQLLQLLAHPPGGRELAPRDIVVMVPDIETFAPAIRAVFGQVPRRDARHIPWGIADQKERGCHPLLVALEALLRAPQQRFGASELRDLLDLPALARRFGIAADGVPLLAAWIEGAGIRWGLHAAQRASLGLGAAGEANTWAFGLRRMLLGHAAGELPTADGFAGIEPYAEVAGLEAGLAGALADLLQVLGAWWHDARTARDPQAWALRLRTLLAALFEPADDDERALVAALDDALAGWLQACDAAGFADAVELAVVREAWLGALDEPRVGGRFKAGGVTFCTLLPLRAIPFEVVCLLGLNDGDYPRRGARADFDLMALPGQARPGDRSRRDDDRQLMLDALLSARRVLHVSWVGRSVRDNTEQPPSVLVAQLRDYLAAGWGEDVLKARTTAHPLQPFSRRYFEPGSGLFTYAAEWRAAHAGQEAGTVLPAAPADAARTLTLHELAAFLRNPVQAFFRHRLQVVFPPLDEAAEDDECFAGRGLARWGWARDVLAAGQRALEAGAALDDTLGRELARLQRAGRLPMAGPGRRAGDELRAALQPMLAAWAEAVAAHPQPLPDRTLQLAGDAGWALQDVLTGLRASDGVPRWIELVPGPLAELGRKGTPARADKLVLPWLRCLAAAAAGQPVQGLLIGEGASVQVNAPPADEARATLVALLQAAAQGLSGAQPLPTALKTGIAFLRKGEGAAASVYDGSFGGTPPEGAEPSLARLFPDFEHLAADPGFAPATERLYAPLLAWVATQVQTTPLPGAEEAADG